ncbi:MAG TPA: FAD-dependent oxidoreductase, partial [Burkholderiaceae bacterium]|nr:FAD-dependent oxidoreductase [Burkholderiaceae bacterium]
MIRLSEIKLSLSEAENPEAPLRAAARRILDVTPVDIAAVEVFKRSFDARKADLSAVYIADVTLSDPSREAALLAKFPNHPHVGPTPDMAWRAPVQAPADLPLRPVVVGFGPCGIFAALVLAQMGFKPIVLERGKPVRERTKDTWGLWRKNVLNPESNVQFGEGGAGTFSDGKLYSQIKDPRYLGRKVMNEFVKAGAPDEILYVAHPHIGTFKLVKVVENMREQIIAMGGEIRFEQRVTDVLIEDGPEGRQLRGLTVLDQATGVSSTLRADHVVMALGHSSRDTFAMLHERGVSMEAKPFSIGFRIEHPQGLIDRARWGRHAGHPLLGAADYKLVHHASNGRSVYSFCMCPGGTVVAATSEPNRVVTNGMSQYSRNERNANAGIVVGIT